MKNRTKKKPSTRAVEWHKTRTSIEQALNNFSSLYNNTKDISFIIRNQELMKVLNPEELSKVTTAAGIVLNTLTDCAARFSTLRADFEAICAVPHDKRNPADFDMVKVSIGTLLQAYNEVVLPQTEEVLTLGYEAAERIEAKEKQDSATEGDTNEA